MKNRSIQPPGMAERLFRRMFPDDGFETTVCDLEESFQEVARERGLLGAFFGESSGTGFRCFPLCFCIPVWKSEEV